MSNAAAIIAGISASRARGGYVPDSGGGAAMPTPVDDITTAVQSGAAIEIDVLANDDLDGLDRSAAEIVLDTTGTAGTGVAVNDDNNIDYTPPSAAGEDTFTYTVNGEGPATVTIQVQESGAADELGALMLALDLDGYWRHAETGGAVLVDSSGEGNDGAYIGSPTFGVDPELEEITSLNRAVQYNAGASAAVALATLPARAVCAYSKRWSPTQYDIDNETSILSRNGDGNLAGNWNMRHGAGGAGRVFFQDGDNQTNLDVPSGTFIAGNWYHAFVLMSGTGVEYWLNGALIRSSAAHTTGETGNLLPLQIGASNYTPNFRGVMHEVARMTTLPTPAEIEARSFFTASGGGGGGGSGGGEDQLAETVLPTALRTVNVSNQSQLDAALGDLTAGDRIRLSNGSYSGFTITTQGTPTNPIVFEAVNVLGARFTSQILIDAPNITLYGTDHTSRVVVGFNSSAPNFRFWRCRLRDISGIAMRTYAAADPDFAFSEWDNIQGRGCLVSYQNGTRRPVWRYCFFHDTPAGYGPQESGGNGECIHWGDNGAPGGVSDPMNGLMHRCKIKAWNSDTEQPSIKCSGNTIRQCTLEDCTGGTGGKFNIRFGYNNTIEACWVRNSGGIGVRAGCDTGSDRHKILGNLVESGGEIEIKAGNAQPCDDTNSPRPFFNAAGWTVVSGNTGTVRVGEWSSSSQNDTVRAQNTRVRQHSGTVTNVFESGTDSQPGVTETNYTWVDRVWLDDADVGPNAGL